MKHSPDFIIIGAMKCATSTLHEQLALQPGIFMTQLKEPNFFSNDEQYVLGIDWYQSHFQGAKPSDLCGESSTHYTKLPTYPHTLERIKAHVPNAKFIYVMRHPIDRLVSQYIHEWTQRRIFVDINQAIYQYPELIDYSRYTMQLNPYFDTFGQNRVLPVFFERLFAHSQDELERICQFIGYSGQPTWVNDLDAQNISSERLRKSAWRDFLVEAPGLKEIRQFLVPKTVRNWIKGFWTLKKRPELEQQQIEYLNSIFDKDLDKLGYWLGVQLSCDSFKSTVKSKPLNWIN